MSINHGPQKALFGHCLFQWNLNVQRLNPFLWVSDMLWNYLSYIQTQFHANNAYFVDTLRWGLSHYWFLIWRGLTLDFEAFFFFFFGLFRAASEAYGGSQARGQIGAVATGLHHNHSNAISKPLLATYTTAHLWQCWDRIITQIVSLEAWAQIHSLIWILTFGI